MGIDVSRCGFSGAEMSEALPFLNDRAWGQSCAGLVYLGSSWSPRAGLRHRSKSRTTKLASGEIRLGQCRLLAREAPDPRERERAGSRLQERVEEAHQKAKGDQVVLVEIRAGWVR